jgi:hypothetical protein
VVAKHILRYFRGTINYGLRYTSSGGLFLRGYAEISLIPLIKIFATDLMFCLADLIHWGVSGCVSVVCLRS